LRKKDRITERERERERDGKERASNAHSNNAWVNSINTFYACNIKKKYCKKMQK
jgi:hypothetical protein